MNLNKFNFYKNSKYVIISSLLILLAGLIVGIICKLNIVEAMGSSVVITGTAVVLVTMITCLVYFNFRYDIVSAFCFSLAAFLNVAVTMAVCAIIRIPVSSVIISVIGVILVLSVLFNIFIFEKIKSLKSEKKDREELVNLVVRSSIKQILLIVALILIALLLSLIIVNINVIIFIRLMIVGLITTALSSIFVIAPIWGYFYRDIPKKKKVIDETMFVDEKDNKNINLEQSSTEQNMD